MITSVEYSGGVALTSERRFEELLRESIDEGLSSLGQSSRSAVYFHLERSFHIEKQEIPYRIELFASAIEKIFGPGAELLETLIMKQLHQKIGSTSHFTRSEDSTLPKYVSAAKLGFLGKKRKLRERRKKPPIPEIKMACSARR